MITTCQSARQRKLACYRPLPAGPDCPGVATRDTEPEHGVNGVRRAAGGRRPAAGGERCPMLRPCWAISEPDLERELLRKSVGALAAERAACADCGRTPLVGERVHRFARRRASSATLCRPRVATTAPSAPSSCTTASAGHTVAAPARAPPDRRRGVHCRAPMDPVTRRDHDRPAARGGLRVPRRRRQPRRVHRPLPGRLAADARGHLRLRRRRALPREDAASTASRGAT